MKRISFLLLLLLIPALLFSLDKEKCEKKQNKIKSEWQRHNELIQQANQLKSTEHGQKITLIREAIACCQRSIAICHEILTAIAKKTKAERRETYWRDAEFLAQQDKDILESKISGLQVSINHFLAQIAIERVQVLYAEGEKKADLARSKDRNGQQRRFDNIEAVIFMLIESVKLYEEAVASIREALSIVAPYPSLLPAQNELNQALQRYQEEITKHKKEATEWPSIITAQKAAIKDHISLLKEKSQLLEAKGFNKSAVEVQKQIIATLEYLVENGDKESLEELNRLKESVATLIENTDDIPAKIPDTISEEDRIKNQQVRRDLFFKNKWSSTQSTSFQKEPRPFAIPVDGQTEERRGEFALFIDQFYRFLIQSDNPVSYLLIKVYDKGIAIHEEKIPLPLKNTLGWQRFLTNDGMVFVPETSLKTEFGLDLYITVVPDLTCPFAFLVSQRATNANYQFSFSLDDLPTLYACHPVMPPPWQLRMLMKPALPGRDKPILKSSPVIKQFDKKENGITHPMEQVVYPALDLLVKELKSDPMLLAQYVQNEIDFVDPFLCQENGAFQAPNIQRGPYATYLDKQGSPWEQCWLLVYLLRKAGYKAEYAIGEPCSVPKVFAEKLLFTQIPDEQQEVLVQYPWVIFFDGKEWISLFPWMKEIQMREGFDLYGLLPEEYASADRWILRYLKGDKNILQNIGADEDDTAGSLFVRFIEKELGKKGLSITDVGIHRTQIKKQYASWEDFPRHHIQGQPEILSNLNSAQFAKVTISIFIHETKEEIYRAICDLVVFENNPATIHFSPLEDGKMRFHFGAGGIIRHYDLPENYRQFGIKVSYNPKIGTIVPCHYEQTFTFTAGTNAALCFTSGGTSSKTTSISFEKFSQEKDEENRLHALLSFVGTTYFERCNRSERILADLHKVAQKTILGLGLSKLTPTLSNNDQNVRLPQVDMMWFAYIPSQTPISWHQEPLNAIRQLQALTNVDFSSNEHQILRDVFSDSAAVSTVKLLQMAHLEHEKKGLPDNGFLVFSKNNFETTEKMPEAAQGIYFQYIKTLNLRKVLASSFGQWEAIEDLLDPNTTFNDWTYAYMTPGLISSAKGSYQEMGTLIFNPRRQWALISNNDSLLHGGLGSPLHFTPSEINQWALVPWLNTYTLQTPSLSTLEHNSIGPNSKSGTKTWISDIREWGKDKLSTVADPVDVVTGAFYINEVDLILPGPFPLEIRRNYNSQNPLIGDLGIGWKLSLNPYLIKQKNKLYAAEADGTVIAYGYNSKTGKWEVFPEDNPELTNFNQKGIGSTANPFHAYIENDTLYGSDGSKRTFENGQLKKWINNQGHSLAFFYNGDKLSCIESSNGDFCGFHYNHEGNISEIYSRDGRRIYYNYNPQGDLIKITLPNTAVISYEYDTEHRIIKETKPHGKILKNRYKDGKVQAQLSPMGPEQKMVVTATFDYQDSQTIVTDAKGGQTTYKIFQKQIYKVIDPLGYQILQSWFIDEKSWFNPETESVMPWKHPGGSARSLKASTDKRGLTTYYLYDSRGNPVEVGLKGEDLTGDGQSLIIKKFAYNDRDLCVQEEVLGQKSLTTYDTKFPYLPKKIATYTDNTLISYIELTYNSLGQIEKEDTSGSITFWKYDSRGLPHQKTQLTGTNDPDVVTTYSYNNQSQCLEIKSADGTQKNDYDIMGNQIESKVFSPSGALLSAFYIGYDLNNQPIWKQTANPNNTIYLDYHASGLIKASRQTLSPSPSVAYTLYEYDDCGYLIEEVDPKGHCTYREYDAIGQVKSETREGHTILFEYEPGGLVDTITSPSKAKTKRLYTTNGLLKEEICPDETKSSIVYDYFGRPIRETKNGVTWEITYDDPHHRVIRTNIVSKSCEIREYDFRGNLIRFTDAAGYSSEKTYDGLGRIKTDGSPSGQKTIWNYQDNLIICTLPNGETTTHRYEAGHIAESKVTDASGTLIAQSSFHHDPETDIQQITQGEEVTTTRRNSLGLPLKIQKGNITTTYEYDFCGNCIAIIDGDGSVTRQKFDGLNRVVEKELPDGSLIGYVYDPDSNLTKYLLPNGSIWTASYDAMHRKTSEEWVSGREATQRWEYTYKNGFLIKAKDSMQRVHSYYYDDEGRLLQDLVDEWERAYAYDKRGLIISAEQTKNPAPSIFSSCFGSGPKEQTKVERAYDPDGKLISEVIYLNGEPIQNTKQIWENENRTLHIDNHKRQFIYQNNRLHSLSADNLTFSYTYNIAGSLQSKTTPQGVTYLSYNTSGLPERVDTTLRENSYSEILNWTSSGKLSIYKAPSKAMQFTYSRNGQLQSAGGEQYEYDFGKTGNGRLTAGPHWTVSQNGIDPFGKVLAEVFDKITISSTYNSMGQVTKYDRKHLEWDPWGKLIKVSDSSFTWEAIYDPFGRRLQTKYIEGQNAPLITTSQYDPEKEFEEIGTKIGDRTYWKIYGANACDAIIDEKGTCVTLMHNAMNQLVAVATHQGAIYNDQWPSAYGHTSKSISLLTDIISYAQSLTWHSNITDPTGLIWLGERYYDPKCGRFLSPDPIGYPACLDLYGYAGGDPINYCDLDGRFASQAYQTIKPIVIGGFKPFHDQAIQTFNSLPAALANHDMTRSSSFQVGSFDLPCGGIGFINGINNTLAESRAGVQKLSQYAGGANIYGIYNATNWDSIRIVSAAIDVIECGLGHMGIHTPPVQLLKNQWNHFIATHGPEEKFLQFSSSGGALHVYNALLTSPKSVQQRIISTAFAPAIIIPRKLCFQSHNYISKRDFVTHLDIMGKWKHGSELQILEPHVDANFLDHEFLSPTFAPILKGHIIDFIKNHGSRK